MTVMVWSPTKVRVYVAEELVELPRPVRVQLVLLKVPPPGGTLLLLQLTVPVGAVADTGVLSVTVAVQLLELDTGSVSDGQRAAVLGGRLSADTKKGPDGSRRGWCPPQHAVS